MYIKRIVKKIKEHIEKHNIRISTFEELSDVIGQVSDIDCGSTMDLLKELGLGMSGELSPKGSDFIMTKYVLSGSEICIVFSVSDKKLADMRPEIEEWLKQKYPDRFSGLLIYDELVYKGITSDSFSQRFGVTMVLGGLIQGDAIEPYRPALDILTYCNGFYINNTQYIKTCDRFTKGYVLDYLRDKDDWKSYAQL